MRIYVATNKLFQLRLSTLRNSLIILGLLWLPLLSIWNNGNTAYAQTSLVSPQAVLCTPIIIKKGNPCVQPPNPPIQSRPPTKSNDPQTFWGEETAGANVKGGVDIRWQVSNLFLPRSFNVYRAPKQSGPYTLVNNQPILDTTNLIQLNATYNLNDPQGKPGNWYKIETLQNHIVVDSQKPFQAKAQPLTTPKQKPALQPFDALENTTHKDTTTTTLKFFVKDDGVYRITYNDLVSAGLNLNNVTGSQVHITTFGKSIQVATNAPGTLSASSFFEFFGFSNRSPYSADAAYFINFDGQGPAIYPLTGPNPFVQSHVSPKIVTSGPNTYYVTSHFEQDNLEVPTEQDPNHWSWSHVLNYSGYTTITETFALSALPANLDSNVQVSMTVTLIGVDLEGINQHNLGLAFNGHTLAQNENWTGNDPVSYTFTFPESWLQNGTNTFVYQTNTALYDGSQPADIIALKYIDLSYVRNPVAANWIEGSFNPGVATTVSGFSDSQVIGYDITDQTNPLRNDVTAVQQPDTSYSVTLGQSQAGLPVRNRNRLYYLTGVSLLHSTANGNGVIGLTQDAPANLKALNNKADYVIIAPSDFITQAFTLANFHQTTYNQNTFVVNVADIYDLFNQGNSSPQAIKDFLSFAHSNWQIAPRWVLLFGNGTYDYRDYFSSLGLIGPNYIPVHYAFGNYPTGGSSDNWYVAGSDGITPYAAIGRLPAQSPDEATQIVSNIIGYVNYLNNPTSTAWEHQAAFVADAYMGDGTPLPLPSYFATDSDAIAQVLQNTNNFTVTKYYNAQTGDGTAAMNLGVSIINYLGHGDFSSWSSKDVLDSGMTGSFNNGNQRPLSVQLTCETGSFDEVTNSLAWEMILAQNGGAIASIAATSLTDEAPDVAMGENIYTQLMNPNNNATLGEGMEAALKATFAQGSDYTGNALFYNLIGDPAIYIAK